MIEILEHERSYKNGFITHTAKVKTDIEVTAENKEDFVRDVSIEVGYHPSGYGLCGVWPVVPLGDKEYSIQWRTSDNCD